MAKGKQATVDDAAALLRQAGSVLLLCHQKPDGDTLGSGLALRLALCALGKQVRIACPDGFPERYAFLYPEGFVPEQQPEFDPELVVAVDVADPKLLGAVGVQWDGRIGLCIDHHPSNTQYAEWLLLDPDAASTTQIMAKVIPQMGVPLTREIALPLYTGLATDTGCFRYSNVTPAALRLGADLIETGIDSFMVNKRMFETKSRGRVELEQLVLGTLEYHYGGQFAIAVIASADAERTGIPEADMDGIPALPRQIEGVEIAATLKQKGPEQFRVSMRGSARFNVSEICGRLGGGGHPRAAGCTLNGTLAAVKSRLVEVVAPDFERLGNG